jgi:serine kinase of HPr protein (carbohydrate metabolism regulator)
VIRQAMASNTIHASAVLVGPRAVLIRGPSGSGKSRLALDLIAAASGSMRFARLVGDDRVHLKTAGGRLLVAPAASLAGLIELRGTGILTLPYEACAVVGLVIDLNAVDAERLPQTETMTLEGVTLPRLAVPLGVPALPAALGHLTFQVARHDPEEKA